MCVSVECECVIHSVCVCREFDKSVSVEKCDGSSVYRESVPTPHTHLSDIVLVNRAFDPHPGPPLHGSGVLDNTQHIGHLLDGHHLLLVPPDTKVTDILNCLLDVLLLEGLYVDISLEALDGHS